jgi:aldehyde:ferredoxin oxidoreductase
MSNGFMGKILWVDLIENQITEESLDEKMCFDYIGGYGLGARILFNRMKAKVDPLGPENILGFLTGPLTGTQALGGSRYVTVGKSPLTGTWGDANSGGEFGPNLKFAGYDGIFFTGISNKPVYLFINDGNAELRDAANLWGKDTRETEDILKDELGKETFITCIGPAGEKMSLIASIINDKGRAAARSGLGAVMGSKKLKAVAVRGKQSVPVFDADLTNELRKKYLPQLGGPVGMFREVGTPGLTEPSLKSGDTPVKNWGGAIDVDFKTAEKIYANAVTERRAKKYGCWHCPIACGGIMKEGMGEYKYPAGVHSPEYETIGMFGSSCLNDNIESIIKSNEICSIAGFDTISAAASIAYAIECYENGLITKKDTNGIEMTWGNHKSIVAMLEKMAKREGFGAVLADGSKKASEKIGKGSEKYAMQIGGQEYPAHNPKTSYTWAVSYRMDATPGRHTRDGGLNPQGVPMPQFDPNAWVGREEPTKIGINFAHIIDCAGLCGFVCLTYPDASVLVEFLNAVTGWNYTMEDLIKTGERITNIRHAFNLRECINPLNYRNPDRMIGKPPLTVGPTAGMTVDEAAIDKEYCLAMDWDVNTTRPSNKKLKELGLEDVAAII